MISSKYSILLYEFSKNSRITTKDLGKLLRTSQQSASYLIQTAIKNNHIQKYYTLIDPAMFGLTNIIVLFNYINFDQKIINNIKQKLNSNDNVTMIEESSLGADLIVQYTVQNLSFFNKENQDFLHEFKKDIKQIAIYPIIVKHIYTRKYLFQKNIPIEWILSDDKNIMQFSEKEKIILKEIRNKSRASIIEIARNTNFDTKTILQIKKKLESEKVIKQYSVTINHHELNIIRERYLINLETDEKKEIDKFISFCKMHKNVLTAFKIIGNFKFIITVERFKDDIEILPELRKEFNVSDYSLFKIKEVIKSETIPGHILD
jgi:DNA-binding Lrp family transcriptional regulator